MLDADDRRMLATAAVWVGLVVLGVPGVALLLGLSVRVARWAAGW